MTERKPFGESSHKNIPPETQLPKKGVIVGTIGGVFMSSIPQTPGYQAMQKEAMERIRLRR